MNRRSEIVRDFARWVAYCSVSGVADEREIYAALDRVDFSPLFDRSRGGESAGGRKHERRKQRIQARVWFGMLVLLVLAVLLTL